jgi:1,4-dihydroxy-2-naphthoate octaprenyltransferase
MVFFVLFGVRNFGNYICHLLYSWEYRLWLQGFGDVFVFYSSDCKYFRCEFLFKQLDFNWFVLPAAIGLLSVGVLNLNNMRDEASDRKSNKNTIVVKLAELKLKYTITFLL